MVVARGSGIDRGEEMQDGPGQMSGEWFSYEKRDIVEIRRNLKTIRAALYDMGHNHLADRVTAVLNHPTWAPPKPTSS